MSTDLSDLRCPKCVGELRARATDTRCVTCGESFPVTDGIFDLRCSPQNYYFNPVPPATMERLIDEMTRENWAATIRSFIRNTRAGSSWLDNLVVDGRYAWKLFLDLSRDSVLLDLGCGLGNLTHNLAPFVRKTYALDLTFLRLAFSRKRFSIFNEHDDITVVAGGDGPHLPFRAGALDCVVLSGVLEWVGEGDMGPFREGSKLLRLMRSLGYHFGRRNPRRVQLQFLKEIRRILKPGGQLFVAIENRFSYEYFTGRPDHHSNLRYGSLLPRFAANLYSIAVNRAPYRTYTYSIPGYKRLLAEAGFPNVEFLGLTRGYSQLQEIMPADVDCAHWRSGLPHGIKERIRRNKYFVPAYGIVGSRMARPWRRLQDGLVARVEQHLTRSLGPGALVMESYRITGKDKLVIKATYNGKRLAIRIPFGPAALRSEQQNARVLSLLTGFSPKPIPCPATLTCGELGPLAYFVEEFLPGEPLARAVLRKENWVLHEVSALLDSLARVAPGIRVLPFTGELYEREVTRRLTRVFEVVPEPEIRRQATEYFRRRLYGIPAAVGMFHGDFSTHNILTDNGRVTGLIDWEAATSEGLPLLDSINYLASAHVASDPAAIAQDVIPMLASGSWAPLEWSMLMERYAALTMDASNHEAWAYLTWLHGVDMRLNGTLVYDTSAIERDVSPVLAKMLGTRASVHPSSTATRVTAR